ncbi:MAG: CoA pyrophosphatase [Bdellovibrionota bacterium]
MLEVTTQEKIKLSFGLTALRGFENTVLPNFFCSLYSSDIEWNPNITGGSAVSLLFIPSEKDAFCNHANLVLIKRSLKVGSHKGQIGFPGGKAEPGERLAKETVLREVEEELGVAADKLTVHASLPPFNALNGNPVIPFILTADVKYTDFCLQKSEVDSCYCLPWSAFTKRKNQPFQFNLFGRWRQSDFYRCEGVDIWGLTARIINYADIDF